MHIIYVTPEFVTESKGGGLATYISNIARILVEHGHVVTIVTASDSNNDLLEWKKNINVERVRRPTKKIIVPVYYLLQSWKLCQRVRKVCKKNNADIIQYASFEAVGFFPIRKVPGVVRISSDCVSWREYKVYDYQERDLERYYLTDKIEYWTEKRIGNVYGPSKATAKIVSERIHRRISVIESPFYLDKSEYDYTLYQAKLCGKKYLLVHSSMSCLKGTHIIAESISNICCLDPEVYFVFAGSDHGICYRDGRTESARDFILRNAGKYGSRVIFVGTLSRAVLYPIIEHAYACLMPSRIDNMPNTCIEAMAMGKIVVGTKEASFEQLIEDGISGFLVKIDNSEELIEAVEKINCLNEEERTQIGSNAKKSTERFSPENIYQQLINYYTEVIRKLKK